MEQFGTFIANHWQLFLALVVILGLLGATMLAPALSGIKSVTVTEATQLINHEDAVILDVRENSEYQSGHVLDSVHVPLAALSKRLGDLEKYKSKPVIVSCRSGSRSASACRTLRKNGFQSVFNLKGGIMAWQSASLPLSKGN